MESAEHEATSSTSASLVSFFALSHIEDGTTLKVELERPLQYVTVSVSSDSSSTTEEEFFSNSFLPQAEKGSNMPCQAFGHI